MHNTKTLRNTVIWVVAIAAGLWALKYASEAEMRRLDKEVDRLCAIDGKSVIYETVKLPADKFNQYGQPMLPNGRDDTRFGYYEKGDQKTLAGPGQYTGAAVLIRDETQIIRTVDGKVIASRVYYGRSGGDWWRQFLSIGQGKSCPNIPEPWSFIKQVFIQE